MVCLLILLQSMEFDIRMILLINLKKLGSLVKNFLNIFLRHKNYILLKVIVFFRNKLLNYR